MNETMKALLQAAAVDLRIGLFTDDRNRMELALDKILKLKTALDAENEGNSDEISKKDAIF